MDWENFYFGHWLEGLSLCSILRDRITIEGKRHPKRSVGCKCNQVLSLQAAPVSSCICVMIQWKTCAHSGSYRKGKYRQSSLFVVLKIEEDKSLPQTVSCRYPRPWNFKNSAVIVMVNIFCSDKTTFFSENSYLQGRAL